MMFGTIVISITNSEFTPGKIISKSEASSGVQPEFAEYVAYRLRNDILDYIDNQYYRKSSKWAPLSESYVKYKKRHNLSTDIWKATGVLRNSIRVSKKGTTFHVGISPSKKYPGTNLKVIDVARWMEYGTTKMPPRPLFRPIITMYRNNIRKYWNEFLNECLDKNGKVIKSKLHSVKVSRNKKGAN